MAGRWSEALDGFEDLGRGLGRQELFADAFLEQRIEPLAELVLLLALPLCRDVDEQVERKFLISLVEAVLMAATGTHADDLAGAAVLRKHAGEMAVVAAAANLGLARNPEVDEHLAIWSEFLDCAVVRQIATSRDIHEVFQAERHCLTSCERTCIKYSTSLYICQTI